MLEIWGIIFLCNKNAANAKARGRKPGGFIALTLILWIGLEFLGFMIGTAAEMELGAYILALGFALIGGLISYSIAKNCKQGNYVPPAQKALESIRQKAQPLSAPVQLNIVRDGSMVGAAMSYAIILNGTPAGTLKNNSSMTITTNQQQNILQVTDAYGNQLRPYLFDVISGTQAEVHLKAGKFLPDLSRGVLPVTIAEEAAASQNADIVSGMQQPQVFYCSACGSLLEPDARFCAKCGTAAAVPPVNHNTVHYAAAFGGANSIPINVQQPADPMRAVWAVAAMVGMWLLMFLFRFLKITYISSDLNAANVFEDMLLGIGLYLLLQKQNKYRLFAVGTFIAQALIAIGNTAVSIAQRILKPVSFAELGKLLKNQPVIGSALSYALTVILILAGVAILLNYLTRSAESNKRFTLTVWAAAGGVFLYKIADLIVTYSKGAAVNIPLWLLGSMVTLAVIALSAMLMRTISTLQTGKLRLSGWGMVWCILCCIGMGSSFIVQIAAKNYYLYAYVFSLIALTGFILLLCGKKAGFFMILISCAIYLIGGIQTSLSYLAYGGKASTQIPLLLGYIIGAANPVITWFSIRSAWRRGDFTEQPAPAAAGE